MNAETGNPFLTQFRFDDQLWVPFNLSETRVKADTAIPVATFELQVGQVARLAWFSIHFIRLLADTPPTKVNSALGAVYLGLYGSRGDLITTPAGQPLLYAPLDIPGVFTTSPYFYQDIGEPDRYTVLAVNNLRLTDVDLCALGTWRVQLNQRAA